MDIKPHSAHDVVGRSPQQRTQQATSKFRKQNKLPWVVGIVILVVVIGAGIWWYVAQNTTQIDSTKYQAVFLQNNQVYFGKLYDYNTNHPYLKNVWYIQTPDSSSSSADSTKTATPSSMQLIQLTKSVHGPEDEMLLNKSNILFVENLASNSQVTKLINSNK